jgi:hypothetical protein
VANPDLGTHDGHMAEVVAPAAHGEVLLDARGSGRWMRVTWHPEADLVVLSLWHQDVCVGSFRLEREDVPDLVNALVAGLADVRGAATTAAP